MNNIEKLLEEIKSYHDKTLKENIENRLQKTLSFYDYNFDIICDRIEKADKKIVVKELSR